MASRWRDGSARRWAAVVRLVALTGYAQEEDRRRTGEAGFDAHLPKPVELEELNHVLNCMPKDRGD